MLLKIFQLLQNVRMNAQKRYTKAFFIALALYGMLFILIFFNFNTVVQPLNLKNEQTISLNHVALISQEKQIAPVKEEPVIQKEIKEYKKVEKVKPKKEVVPAPIPEETSALKEESPVKEAIQESQNNQEDVTKEVKKEQEFMEKSIPQNYEQAYLNENLQKIVKLIQEHIQYPKRAREMGVQGEVRVQFMILQKGGIQNLEALQGHMLLKKSALKAIEEASALFPKVQKDLTINVPIQYNLVQRQ